MPSRAPHERNLLEKIVAQRISFVGDAFQMHWEMTEHQEGLNRG
jgi:hypothetical protein